MNTAYHYTTWRNWLDIQRDGITPYLLNKPCFRYDTRGIWMYPRRLQGDEHVGSVLWQVCMKREMHVVLLKCRYDPRMMIGRPESWNVTHSGTLGEWQFHHDTPCVVVTEAIPPEDIELVGDYDLHDKLVAQSYVLGS